MSKKYFLFLKYFLKIWKFENLLVSLHPSLGTLILSRSHHRITIGLP